MEGVKDDDKGDGRTRTQLLLNTPGACFLCLQDNYGSDEGGPEDLNGGIIDLTNICRHLNINQCSLLSTSLKNDGGDTVEELERQLCSFSVKLCPKCLELTRKLNDMIIKLEEVKLMVNYHLSYFHKVLEGDGEEESLEWINLLGRMHATSDNSFEAKLVQLLREETKDKSFKILKKAEAAKPEVILSKLAVAPPPPKFRPSEIPSPGTFPSIKAHLSHLTTTNAIPSKKKSPKSKKLLRCPFCSKVLSISKFAIHLACLHSDHLLSSHFPPSSLPPSPELCKKVLYTEVIAKATKMYSASTPTSPRLGCHLCGITYSDGTLLKHHFLLTHTAHLIEAIANFQPKFKKPAATITKLTKRKSQVPPTFKKSEDIQINNPKIKKSRVRRSVEDKTCSICGHVVVKYDQMKKHQLINHPDHLFSECKPGWMEEEQWKGICQKIFKREVRKATFGKPGNKIFKCGYCPPGENKRFRWYGDLKLHLAYQHREEMEGMLREDGGGDHLVVEEEDALEFDVKPEVGQLNELLYPDTVLNEDDGNLEYLEQQYGYFGEEEDGGDGGDNEVDERSGIGNVSNEQTSLPENYEVEEIVKMDVDEENIWEIY